MIKINSFEWMIYQIPYLAVTVTSLAEPQTLILNLVFTLLLIWNTARQ